MKHKSWMSAIAVIIFLSLCSCSSTDQPTQTVERDTILITALFGESTTDPGVGDMLLEKIKQTFPYVDLEWESVDWGERFAPRLNAKIASGETPDLIIGKAQDVHTYQAISAIGAFPDDFSSLLTDQGLIASTIDGKLFGLTYNQLYQGVLYNKNIFYRFNLTVPETLKDLYTIVDRLESAGVTPFATHFQETWYTGNILMQFAINNVFAEKPDWGDSLRNGSASFTTDAGYLRSVDMVRYQFEHTWKDALNVSQSEADQRFADEKAAIYLTGSWTVQTLQSIAPYRKIGIFPFPTEDGGAKLIVEPNITFMKSASTQYDELLDDICRAILSDVELARTLCAFTQTDSTLRGVDSAEANDSLKMIREDINRYAEQGRLISASVGNNQIVWEYQYTCAESLVDYLKRNTELPSVLARWDELRAESQPRQ